MRVDGQESVRGPALFRQSGFRRLDVSQAPAAVARRASDGFSIQQDPQAEGILFHHRRRVDDGEFLFLVNTSIEKPSCGAIRAAARDMQQWDLHTGETQPYAYAADGDGVKAEFALPPSGSLLLFLSKQPGGAATHVAESATTNVPAVGATEIRRLGPNVLTLDFVDVKVKGGADSDAKQNAYFYHAARFIFQKHGLSGDPWDSAVQFRDELITKTFPQDSGFEVTYRFTIQERVPPALHIVIERPDLYTITCNGQPITARAGDWWLDRAFGRLDITAAARVGENAVTLQAAPLTMYHEVEPAYVLGEFALEPTAAGFAIVPDRPLALEQYRAHDNQIEGTMWLTRGSVITATPPPRKGTTAIRSSCSTWAVPANWPALTSGTTTRST